MAKKRARAAKNELQGKKVALVGTFGYRDVDHRRLERLVAGRGGRIVQPTDKPDFLFVGEGRRGKPPADVAKVQQASPGVVVLADNAFLPLLAPESAAILAAIKRGRLNDEERERFWSDIAYLAHEHGLTLDFTGADLREVDLQRAQLQGVKLTGADMRGADLTKAHLGQINNVRLDNVAASNAYFDEARNCTFCAANLEEAEWFCGGGQRVADCDFSRANLKGLMTYDPGTFANCSFVRADLSDTKVAAFRFQSCDFSQAKLLRLRAKEAKFVDCNFAQADLYRADLRNASLKNADLRGANLREAVLCGADLRGAQLAGADFADANLAGAKLSGVDLSQALNLKVAPKRDAGPKLNELAAAARGAKNFETSATVDLGDQEFAVLEIKVSRFATTAKSKHKRPGRSEIWDPLPAKSLEEAIGGLVERWHIGKLRLDSITASGTKTVRGTKLKQLAAAAWTECFIATPSVANR
jgi:uncharacterized protein YjbI with pentapeptide repeats